VSEEAKVLASEYVRLFTLEAIKRAAQEAKNKHTVMQEMGIYRMREIDDEDDDLVDEDDFRTQQQQRNSSVPVTLECLETVAAQLFFAFK
jgi:hypothetical protein